MSGEHRDDLVMQSLLLDEIGQSVIGMDGDWRITGPPGSGSKDHRSGRRRRGAGRRRHGHEDPGRG
jgi:hypothetical protein